MPIEITCHHRIRIGNEAIAKLENYKKTNGVYPETGDGDTLRKIGLKFYGETTWPDYQKRGESYTLKFLEGFDGPYLMYVPEEKKWKWGGSP